MSNIVFILDITQKVNCGIVQLIEKKIHRCTIIRQNMTVKSNYVLGTGNIEKETQLCFRLQNRLTKYTDYENEHYIRSYKASTLSNYYYKNLV